MAIEKVNLAEKFGLFTELWTPKIVGEVNQTLVKVVKVRGEFLWHKHDEEDELFLVVEGRLTIHLIEPATTLNTGDVVSERTVAELQRI
jgi:quercetin dioxygenase-like cupin family protein